ncbi:uncharacterized protein PHALS_09842 [Globisporangium polare]
MQRRPREVPVDRPSAVQTYVPKALLRDDPREQSSSQRRRWLPAGGKPDASKHLSNTQAKRAATHKVEAIAYCSEPQVAQLHALEEEMDKLVQEFCVAAATFSAQSSAQKALVRVLLDHE